MKDMRHKQKLILNNVKYANFNNHDWQWKLSIQDPTKQNVQPMALLNLATYQLTQENMSFCFKIVIF